MSGFFKSLGKVVDNVKGFVEEMEESEIKRKKETLEKLKKANEKKSEREKIDAEIKAERQKLVPKREKEEGVWF